MTLTFVYSGKLHIATWWDGLVPGTTQKVIVGYDDNLRPATENINGTQSVSFGYDDDGLLISAGTMSVVRSLQRGMITQATLGAVTQTRSYTPFGEANVLQAKYNAENILLIDHAVGASYDKRGRLVDKSEQLFNGAATAFHYDYNGAGQLANVTKGGLAQGPYTYDQRGNRNGAGWGVVDAQDRLPSSPYASAYTYGANGELASKTVAGQTTTYTYDLLGNLRQVQRPGQPLIEYVVDGLNHRVGRKANGTLQKVFLYNGDRLVAELDGAGTLVSRFIYATGRVAPDYMVKVQTGETFALICDHLGSVRMVVKTAAGSTAALSTYQQIVYDPWGKVLSDTAPGFQPFGFAGGLYDPDTKLVRFDARDYDPEIGRWTAKDPSRFRGGLNFYVYTATIRSIGSTRAVATLGSSPGLLLSVRLPQPSIWTLFGYQVVMRRTLVFRVSGMVNRMHIGIVSQVVSLLVIFPKVLRNSWKI